MNLLKKLALGVLALVVVVVAIGFLLPRTTEVERSIVIDAPRATVFTVLNGFRNFDAWSPWAGLDPQARQAYTGPVQGVGAKMSWSGNEEVGSGSQEIIESTPYEYIRVRLAFGEWDGGETHATYAISPQDGGTKVAWTFHADYGGSLLGRYFGLLMDGFIGADYEKGLAQLKTFVEQLPDADFEPLDIEVIEAEPVAIAYTSLSSADEGKAIGVALGVAYGKVSGFINAQGLKQVAPPLALYQPPENGVLRFDAGIPIDRDDVLPAGDVKVRNTFGGTSVRAIHQGPYSGLPAAHDAIEAFLGASGYEREGPVMEQYISDPGNTPDAELITHIVYPVR